MSLFPSVCSPRVSCRLSMLTVTCGSSAESPSSSMLQCSACVYSMFMPPTEQMLVKSNAMGTIFLIVLVVWVSSLWGCGFASRVVSAALVCLPFAVDRGCLLLHAAMSRQMAASVAVLMFFPFIFLQIYLLFLYFCIQ